MEFRLFCGLDQSGTVWRSSDGKSPNDNPGSFFWGGAIFDHSHSSHFICLENTDPPKINGIFQSSLAAGRLGFLELNQLLVEWFGWGTPSGPEATFFNQSVSRCDFLLLENLLLEGKYIFYVLGKAKPPNQFALGGFPGDIKLEPFSPPLKNVFFLMRAWGSPSSLNLKTFNSNCGPAQTDVCHQ